MKTLPLWKLSFTLLAGLILAAGPFVPLRAADATAAPTLGSEHAAMMKKIDAIILPEVNSTICASTTSCMR
jgi:hypothetical protein